jgi:hypothetical protein
MGLYIFTFFPSLGYTFWCSVSMPELLRCGSPLGSFDVSGLPFMHHNLLLISFLREQYALAEAITLFNLMCICAFSAPRHDVYFLEGTY